MTLTCPSCGIKLEKDFKFCPNCGFGLSQSSAGESEINKKPAVAIMTCNICGEENKSNNLYCSGCGAKLDVSSGIAQEKNSASVLTPQRDIKNSKKLPLKPGKPLTAKKTSDTVSPSANRALSIKQLVSILLVIAGIMLVILFASGVFDSAPVAPGIIGQQQSQTNLQNQSPGVDLSTLNEINSLEEKVKSNPGDSQSILHLAHLKNDAGFYEKAIASYRQYLEINPSDADARVDLGVCYFNLKDYKSAIEEMQKALKYKPDHQIAHLNLGIVNLAAGNLNESKVWLKKAVELDSNSEIGHRAKELLESH